MLKQFFTKIASILIALLVLVSTFSFTVDKHYCGDFLVDISFTGEAEGCGMNMDSTATAKKKNCCKYEVQKFEGQDELQTSKVENITFENQQFLTAFLISLNELRIEDNSEVNFYKNFTPPDSPKDFQVLFQSFLI
jgi:hypothetical protein